MINGNTQLLGTPILSATLYKLNESIVFLVPFKISLTKGQFCSQNVFNREGYRSIDLPSIERPPQQDFPGLADYR